MEKPLFASSLGKEEIHALITSCPARHCPIIEETMSRQAEEILKGERLHFSKETDIPGISLESFFAQYAFAIDTQAYNLHKGTGADESEAMDRITTEILRLYSQETIQPLTPHELSEALTGDIPSRLTPTQELQLENILERILFTQI